MTRVTQIKPPTIAIPFARTGGKFQIRAPTFLRRRDPEFQRVSRRATRQSAVVESRLGLFVSGSTLFADLITNEGPRQSHDGITDTLVSLEIIAGQPRARVHVLRRTE